MLVKVNGILQSEAPADGEAGGGSAAADNGAPADNGMQEETGSSDEAFNDGGADESEDDFGAGFDMDEFLNYDPMKTADAVKGKQPEEEEEETPSEDAAEKAAKALEGKDPKKPAEAKKDPEPGQKEKENPEMKLLQEQVKQLTQLLNQQQTQASQAAAEKEKGAEAKGAKTPEQRHQEILQSLPKYDFKIPDEVMKKFSSEDPATVQAGLAEYASGIAQVTHYNLLAQIRQEMDALREELLKESVQTFKNVTKEETAAEQQRSKISQDFYGKFPELDKPELKLLVQTQAKYLAEQYGVKEWNDSFRDALGEQVKKTLGLTSQGPQPNEISDKKKAGAGQRFNSGSGAGRSKPSGAVDEQSDIADTLGI